MPLISHKLERPAVKPLLDVFLQVMSIRHRVCQKISISFLFQKPLVDIPNARVHSAHMQAGGLWSCIPIEWLSKFPS